MDTIRNTHDRKGRGKPYLTRLRVIHLFEADYSLFLKIVFDKRLVRNREKHDALNDQQHGSRPRRMTTNASFLFRLEKDLIRQTKSNSPLWTMTQQAAMIVLSPLSG